MDYITLDELKVAAEVKFIRLLKAFEEKMQGERMKYKEVVDASEPQEPDMVQGATPGQLEQYQ